MKDFGHITFDKTGHDIQTLKKLTRIIAASSFEIFLIQMVIIYSTKYDDFTFIDIVLLRYVLWIVVWILSIGGGIELSYLLSIRLHKNEDYRKNQE